MDKTKELKITTTTVNVGILMLTLTTAIAHLYLSTQPGEDLRLLFLLNALGFLGLLTAFLLPIFKSFHRLVGWIFLGYTLLTILMWFLLGGPKEGEWDPFDIVVKTVEFTLAIQLFLDSKRWSNHPQNAK